MKKIFLLPLFLLIGCKSYLINTALERVGVYEENVKIKIISNNEKKIVFVPMKHIATELFYDNVRTKIDSLEKNDYCFYYELVNGIKDDSITLKKFRKISGLPENKKGYLETLDSVLKGVKYKKKLVDQPKDQMELGFKSNKSKNVDVTIQEIIKHYESLNGEIILEKCDFDAPIYNVTKCKNKNIDKKKLEKSILDFRNEHIVKEINSDSRKNIAIVYGAAHFDGVLKLLQEKDSTWVEIK
jgi:uncharacterized protein YcfL